MNKDDDLVEKMFSLSGLYESVRSRDKARVEMIKLLQTRQPDEERIATDKELASWKSSSSTQNEQLVEKTLGEILDVCYKNIKVSKDGDWKICPEGGMIDIKQIIRKLLHRQPEKLKIKREDIEELYKSLGFQVAVNRLGGDTPYLSLEAKNVILKWLNSLGFKVTEK